MNEHQRRAADAKQLLENPLLTEALDVMVQHIDERMRSADTSDPEFCADLVRQRQAIEWFKRQFKRWLEEGQIADFAEARQAKSKPGFQR